MVAGAGAFALLRTPTHTVGSYVDLSLDEARSELEAKGLRVATESQVSETVPVDVVNAGLDVMSGGDGSKRSRNRSDDPISMIEKTRDAAADTLKELDND